MDEHTANIIWPPAYKIKKHRLARNIKLRAVKLHGLEITVPYRFDLDEIPTILEENKNWITKRLLHLQSQSVDSLPDKIVMHAMNETWLIHYVACSAKLEIIQRPTQEVILVGKIHNKNICKERLITWIKERATIYLIQQLKMISDKAHLYYKKVTVRDQRTLWGSCTVNKAISLNYKLIFLPSHLVTHILIHELCHTQYLNHSEHFWSLVAKYDPAWQTHRYELRLADQFIPQWI